MKHILWESILIHPQQTKTKTLKMASFRSWYFWVSSRQHIRDFCGKSLSAEKSAFHWEQIAPVSSLTFSILIQSKIYTISALSEIETAIPFNFTYMYIADDINSPDFENYLWQVFPVELRSKTRQRATFLLPTFIYSSWSGEMVNSILPLSLNLYARACSSNECFIPRARRLSSKLLKQGYLADAWNRHSGSFMVDTGILFSNMEYRSHEC